MQDLVERAPARGGLAGSIAVLVVAAALLPFANGGHSIPAAAFLAPLFLLRFTRTRGALVGLLTIYALQSIAFSVQFRGMVPAPGLLHTLIVFVYGGAATAPYVVDRILAPRLRGWPATLVFPCAWAAMELLVSFSPYGSWGAVGYALYGSLPLVQILAVTGLSGLAFLIGWFAALGNRAWELGARSPLALRTAGIAIGVPAVVLLLGGARLALFPPDSPTVRVASLSPEGTPSLHPDPKVLERFFAGEPLSAEEIATIRARAAAIDDGLLTRARDEARAGARIVFWGEANAPVFSTDEADLVRRGQAIAKESGAYLGMALAVWHFDAAPPFGNKLVLVDPEGRIAWEYIKARPVPGGEAAMSRRGDGKLKKAATPYGALTGVICFDGDFPSLLAQAGELRADIVLDPSNDWKAIDPWHTRMASFRAIEQGVNLVRQTSRGWSAAFDYEGHVLAAMDHYTATDRTLVSQVPTRGTRTPYGLIGDWFAWLCVAGLAILGVAAVRRR
jgi:apolipoprotein N-acyltransferase